MAEDNKAPRTVVEICRDFGKLVDELVALEPIPAPGHIINIFPAEARLPQDIGFRISQIVQSRARPPMPNFNEPAPAPKRTKSRFLTPIDYLGKLKSKYILNGS